MAEREYRGDTSRVCSPFHRGAPLLPQREHAGRHGLRMDATWAGTDAVTWHGGRGPARDGLRDGYHHPLR
jgi:hypothetical protein